MDKTKPKSVNTSKFIFWGKTMRYYSISGMFHCFINKRKNSRCLYRIFFICNTFTFSEPWGWGGRKMPFFCLWNPLLET